jgi:hypothetical protein
MVSAAGIWLDFAEKHVRCRIVRNLYSPLRQQAATAPSAR